MMRITKRPVADNYAAFNEQIVEFSSTKAQRAGGLVSFTENDDGTVTVDLYRLDPGVQIRVSKETKVTFA